MNVVWIIVSNKVIEFHTYGILPLHTLPMVKLTDGNILYTFMVIDGLGDCYAWYLSCNYQTIHCLVIWKDLLTTETEEIQVFGFLSILKQWLREDIQKKKLQIWWKRHYWGGGGQKNYWIFIIYKWWKTWKGRGSQSNISLLHRTQLWLV